MPTGEGSADVRAAAILTQAAARKGQSLWKDAWRRLRKNRFAMGGLVVVVLMALLAFGADLLERDDIYLHHFNIRGLILPENSFDLPLPAIVAGIHFKYNDTIKKLDKRLGGALKGLGLDKANGVDYTLTASKMFPTLAFGRPIILTAT